KLDQLGRDIAPLYDMVQSSPLLFNNTDEGDWLSSTKSTELKPSPLMHKILSKFELSMKFELQPLSTNSSPEEVKAYFSKYEQTIDQLIDNEKKFNELSKTTKVELNKEMKRLNQAANYICNEQGKNLHNYPSLVEKTMEEIFEHNNSKQQVAATQAAYCHLLNTKPLIEDGLSVASIAGFAMLGVGFGLQFIPGVGTVAGGMVLSASTALLAGGGGMLTGVGIKDTIDSQSKLNREIGLHSADLNDYQNVIIAKEIRNTNVVMSVVDTALVPVDLAAYRILKNKTPNLPAETIVKNTDRRVEHRGKNTNRQGARRFDDALRSTVDQVENELGKVKKLKLLLKYNKAEYNLNPRDKIYLAAMADMLEQELKKNKGLKGKKLKKKVQKELDKIINKCNGVKGI
ncbi:MAG: hypothetical protein HON90_05195, partial [Halobacteriovoraceae bacterium]|nr:hypothetical protein [Halobacteriovoraceae bacterium]